MLSTMLQTATQLVNCNQIHPTGHYYHNVINFYPYHHTTNSHYTTTPKPIQNHPKKIANNPAAYVHLPPSQSTSAIPTTYLLPAATFSNSKYPPGSTSALCTTFFHPPPTPLSSTACHIYTCMEGALVMLGLLLSVTRP